MKPDPKPAGWAVAQEPMETEPNPARKQRSHAPVCRPLGFAAFQPEASRLWQKKSEGGAGDGIGVTLTPAEGQENEKAVRPATITGLHRSFSALPSDGAGGVGGSGGGLLTRRCSTPSFRLQPASPAILLRRKISLGTEQLERNRAAAQIAKVLEDKRLLIHIFRFLPKAALVRSASLVAKVWCQAAAAPELWLRIDLTKRRIALLHLQALLDRNPRVVRLFGADIEDEEEAEDWAPDDSDASYAPWSPPAHASHLCSKLTYLDLSLAAYKGPHVLASILRRVRNLACLSLELGKLDDKVTGYIAANRRLTHLNLAMASGLSPQGFKGILQGCL